MSAQRLPLPAPVLSEENGALLTRLVDGLDAPTLWWLSGYTAALAQTRSLVAPARPTVSPPAQAAATAAPVPAAQEQARLSIVYGSQTGNARRVAEQLAAEAEAGGLAVRLLRADAYPLRELASERLLYVVISTQGDGDPPDDARALVDFLAGRRAPKLPELRYAVLGLGDSSYPQFCAIGRRLDARLAELGASRLFAAAEADLDIDTVAAPWRTQALQAAREMLRASSALATVTPLRPASSTPTWTRERPFEAELLASQRLTGRGSDKHVRHLEFSLAGSGLNWQPGDALGVWHRNAPALVDAVLQATGLNGDAGVEHGGETRSLRDWLTEKRELTRLARPTLAALAERSADAGLARLLDGSDPAALGAVLADHQLIDALHRWRADWDPAVFVSALRPLTPRLYSIASSQAALDDEVHLTVDVLRYAAHGREHGGAASGFLARLGEGESARVYIEPNDRFRLPADDTRDVIMIGPGTGVAPFRAFLQERAARAARGRHWLFFGNPHFRSDFLYQTEWQQALREGRLQRLDLAFSRDGVRSVDGTPRRRTYVQQRLRERGRDLHAWLDGGAHLYVCGAVAMGRDVHAALREIVSEARGVEAEEAEAWLSELQRQGRYARDVY